ncbi:unnamed protein product, partial [Owenia fusiformis]
CYNIDILYFSSKPFIILLTVLCLLSIMLTEARRRQCKQKNDIVGAPGGFKHFNRALHFIAQASQRVLDPKLPMTEWWHKVHNWAGRSTKNEIVGEGLRALRFSTKDMVLT